MRILLSFFCLSAIFGCGGNCSCMPDTLSFSLVQFTDAEADTVIIKAFSKNTNFTQLKDSIFANADSIHFHRSGDTLNTTISSVRTMLFSTYDYEIFLPGANRTFRIANIVQEQKTMHCGGLFGLDKVGCVNPTTSYSVNGTTVYPRPFTPVYLHK